MAYRMTKNEYKEIREKSFTLLYFDSNGRRGLWYSGLNASKVITESLKTILPILIMDDEQKEIWGRKITQWEYENRTRIPFEEVQKIKSALG